MSLFTTYLGYLKAINRRNCGQLIRTENALENVGLREPKIYYVMLNRGNNEVAPTREALNSFKVTNDWNGYVKWYQNRLRINLQSKQWIQRVAEESLCRDVVLVCFEKDHLHCHRSLLANEIVRQHPEVNYVGELRYESS